MTEFSVTKLSKLVAARILGKQTYKLIRKSISETKLLEKFSVLSQNRRDFVETFKVGLRRRFFISDLNRKEFYLSLMTSIEGFDSIMDNADLVHENRFKALGSEPFSFGEKIDWHLDFKSRKKWPLAFYTKIDPLGMGDQSDIKVPWELSRLHQAVWLGKAYWVSHSEAHPEKFKQLVNDWIDSNPVAYGVNWASPMEASIRAMNLIVGLLYFIGSEKIDDAFFLKLICSLYDHAVYIRHNLEITLRSGNHYISNLVALIYLGIFFNDTKIGKRWTHFAQRELEKEILNQVFEDGTDYEKSISYHCLVAELLTAAYVLLKLNRFELSHLFKDRLEKMFEFIASAAMHDGTAPAIGDSDDGRIFRMAANANPNDYRDLLSAGAVLFERGDFKTVAGKYSSLALLFLGSGGFEKFTSLRSDHPVKSSIYPEGGFAFLKTEKDFCSFDFGDIGKRGRGGHGHNDILSFTISGKHPFIVDRGTYCYTCNEKLRNKLRSVYSHNTAIVDGKETAEFSGLWSIKKDFTQPKLLDWKSNDEQDIIEAQHSAYEKLAHPVIHRRKITLNKRQRTFLLEDNFSGTGVHQIELMFHFAPELKVVETGRNFLVLEGEEFALMKFRHKFNLESWEHSPSYGVIQTAMTARLKITSEVPLRIETFIFILSSLDEIHDILNRLR